MRLAVKAVKVIVQASTRLLLAQQLRKLAAEVEEGYDNMNVADRDGVRMMRALREDEKTFFLDVRDMP